MVNDLECVGGPPVICRNLSFTADNMLCANTVIFVFAIFYRFERMLFILPGTRRARVCLSIRIACVLLLLLEFVTNALRHFSEAALIRSDVKTLMFVSTILLFVIAFLVEVYCNIIMIKEVLRTSRKIRHAPKQNVKYFKGKLWTLIGLMIIFDFLALADRAFINLFSVGLIHARGLASLLLLDVIKDGLDNDLERENPPNVPITMLSSIAPPTEIPVCDNEIVSSPPSEERR